MLVLDSQFNVNLKKEPKLTYFRSDMYAINVKINWPQKPSDDI